MTPPLNKDGFTNITVGEGNETEGRKVGDIRITPNLNQFKNNNKLEIIIPMTDKDTRPIVFEKGFATVTYTKIHPGYQEKIIQSQSARCLAKQAIKDITVCEINVSQFEVKNLKGEGVSKVLKNLDSKIREFLKTYDNDENGEVEVGELVEKRKILTDDFNKGKESGKVWKVVEIIKELENAITEYRKSSYNWINEIESSINNQFEGNQTEIQINIEDSDQATEVENTAESIANNSSRSLLLVKEPDKGKKSFFDTRGYLTNRQKKHSKNQKILKQESHELQGILNQEQLKAQVKALPYGTPSSKKTLKEGTSSELEEMGGAQAFEMAYELREKYLETRSLTIHSYDSDILAELEEKHWNIIQQILSKYPYHFYAYGSRAKGTAKKFSELDLCYKEEIPLSVISRLREEFTASNLPFEVELVLISGNTVVELKSRDLRQKGGLAFKYSSNAERQKAYRRRKMQAKIEAGLVSGILNLETGRIRKYRNGASRQRGWREKKVKPNPL
ncbi:4819_t:CDS:10 [Funneliformis geosporum]|nr:4819_t:CDS:10 [Funneliformis geosporum]